MEFTNDYFNEVIKIARHIDKNLINRLLAELINLKKRKGRLFILGVGGSAGNASHAVNDFRKLADIEAYAPTDNISEITARTNDEGWETVFEGYLKISKLNEDDCILILSVGGGSIEKEISVNLCKAIDYARLKKTRILGIVGRVTGYTQEHADVCVTIPDVNPLHITPHSEAFQTIIWHLLVTHPALKTNTTKW